MEHAKAEWNKRSLTDKAWLHRGAHGPGCKIEDKKKKKRKKEARGTRAQAGICQGSEIIQARGVI